MRKEKDEKKRKERSRRNGRKNINTIDSIGPSSISLILSSPFPGMVREAGFDAVDAGFHAFPAYQQVKNHEIPAAFSGTAADFLALCRRCKETAERYGLFHSQIHTPFPTYRLLKNDPVQ